MDKFNDFFVNLAEKIPFAKDFFKSKLAIFGIEISNLFLVLVSLVLIIIALVLIIALITTNAKNKKRRLQDSAEETDTQTTATDADACLDTQSDTLCIKKQDVVEKTEEPLFQSQEVEETATLEEEAQESMQEEEKKDSTQEILADDIQDIAEEDVADTVAATATVSADSKAEVVIEYAVDTHSPTDTKKEADKRYSGKYEIYVTTCGYRFYLMASNGQLLYESNGYTTVEGATRGIETFKNAVKTGTFIIDEDKFGRFRFVLNKRYVGENYTTKPSCENSIGSVKKFSQTATLMPYIADTAKEQEYKASLESQKNQKEVDWEKIEKEEALTKPSGKFEISQNANGYRFVLLANNGQLLYSSNGYASHKSAFEGIKTFKRTVYTGNFFVDEDKFGRFRYILRGATFMTTYTGESYTTRSACERVVESVKNFVKSAVMPE